MKNKIETKVKIKYVKLIIENKMTIDEVSYKLGVSSRVIKHWINTYIANQKKKRIRALVLFVINLVICLIIIILVRNNNKSKTVSDEIINNNNSSESVEENNNNYSGIGKIFIDPGHGFSDAGTIPPDEFNMNFTESEVVLDIANRVTDILKKYNYDVAMSRTENYNEIQEKKIYKIKMGERVKLAQEYNADVFVSLHINAYKESSEINGLDIYYCEKDETYNKKTNKLSEAISQKFIQKTGIEDIKIHQEPRNSAYYVTKMTTMPSVLFEMGYVTNKEDAKRFLDEDFLNKLSVSIAEGIMKYLTEELTY
ncbi:MAG: N-acetylmuramoyl-L-alanine amidase [Vallitalea sp.]|jgi:N-acetylmuramoyl-L-alanine amidase|nr:N-acetylmuramoyl-L-alanine amidase [Vallitalea sp.]